MTDELKQAILQVFQANLEKGKKKLYIKDLAKDLPNFPKPDVKLAVQDMIEAGDLAYWSSGSTTYVMLTSEFEKYKDTMEGPA